jgi:hypothetical protein
VSEDGDSTVVVFDEDVTAGADGFDDLVLDMSAGAVTLTYDSGDGSDTITYTNSRTVINGETGTYDYPQPGDGIQDLAGIVLATVSDETVTNGSTSEDTTPDAFTFTAQTGIAISTLVISNTIVVTNITAAAAISIVNGEYSVNTGTGFSAFTSSPSTVASGAQVRVRATSSASFSTLVTATLTIGGVSGAFNVTTQAADATPTQFTFIDQTSVPVNTTITSNLITVSGINTTAAISIESTGTATYAINGGVPTSSPGTVVNGDTVIVYLLSSASAATATSATLTIGGVVDVFNISTGSSTPSIIYSAASFYIEDDLAVAGIVGGVTVTGTITYSILSGNTDSDFAINTSTGIISVANTLSNARTPSYTLVVRATNSSALTANMTVTINVAEAGSTPSITVWTIIHSGLN